MVNVIPELGKAVWDAIAAYRRGVRDRYRTTISKGTMRGSVTITLDGGQGAVIEVRYNNLTGLLILKKQLEKAGHTVVRSNGDPTSLRIRPTAKP